MWPTWWSRRCKVDPGERTDRLVIIRPWSLPIPPLEMRALVGTTEEMFFDNPSGDPIFDDCDTTGIYSISDVGAVVSQGS